MINAEHSVEADKYHVGLNLSIPLSRLDGDERIAVQQDLSAISRLVPDNARTGVSNTLR